MPNVYSKLARHAIEEYINNNIVIKPAANLPQKMRNDKAGVFVSIHKKNPEYIAADLRGCIGTFLPTKKNIAKEIIDNAISAATRDYRFDPITKDELPNLEISVDILCDPEPIHKLSSLDPKKYGVIVKSENGRTGLLLPDIKGIKNADHQVAIARQKALISPNEPVYLFRFMVKRYKE